MFDKARKLPLLTRIVLTIILSVIWIFIASNFDIDIQANWILSTLVIAGISSMFFSFSKQDKAELEKNLNVMANENAKYSKEKITFNSSTKLIEVLTFVKDNSAFVGIELNKPATDNEIDFFEKNKIKLPQDFIALYKFSNGFETDEDLFRFIPLNEIINNGKDDYCISETSFHFSEYMIYSDMWTVEINPLDIENYKIYNKADNVVYLTNSLAEFLCIFINKGIYDGLYEWREKNQNV